MMRTPVHSLDPRAQRGVILAHPGTQYSYETAFALQEAGLLQCYMTGFYFKPENSLGRALRLLPNGRGTELEREFRRRFKPELAPQNVRTYPAAELIYVVSSRLRPLRPFSEAILRWRNKCFDGWVAKRIARERPKAVVCYDSCAQRTFEGAKSLGTVCVLDQSIGHICTGLQLLREEAKLHPDFADSLPTNVPEWLIERCSQEALLADCVLSPSEYVRHSLIANGVEPARIAALPFGVDPERFQPGLGRMEKTFRLLFVGQLSQRKGIKYLLEAFRSLRLPSAELVLVGNVAGSGKGLLRYRDMFQHIPNVPRAEVHHWFERADVFVYPSLHEGSALAIYEALACGLPIITTPNSGSIVQDGIQGYIVPIRDVERLKEKILLLYENRELRQEMSRRARLRAEEFTWAAYRQRLGSILLNLLAAKG
jgi:alpha-maltose-1-phosphate synthase